MNFFGIFDAIGALSGNFPLISAGFTLILVVVSAIIAYEILSRPPPVQNPGIDVLQQSEPVPGVPGARRRRYVDGNNQNPHSPQLTNPPATTYEIFSQGMQLSNNGDCIGWRTDQLKSTPYTWLSYSQVRQRATNFGSGLLHTGLLTAGGDDAFLGIYAKNCVEWFIAGQACAAYRLVIVPLYDTLGKAAIQYVLNQSQLSVLLVDGEGSVQNVLATDGGVVKMIVTIQPVSQESTTAAQCKLRGIKLTSFAELEANGAEKPLDHVPAQPDDLYIICYTSGTTGDPKGVMITQKSVAASVMLIVESSMLYKQPTQGAILSYLPLAHMYEQLVNQITFFRGCKIGLFGGNIQNITQDMQALHPVMLPMVPRIMARLYQSTMSSVQKNFAKKALLNVALYFKIREIKMGIYRRNSIWDYLVFRRIQNVLGGNLAVLVVVSAPSAAKVLDFTRAALGVPVYEAYGQTESGGCTTCTVVQDEQCGQVGPPAGDALIKLVDVPELDYIVDRDGVGEIWIKSPVVMRGYFRDEKQTAETVDAENWLHSGDIGRWNERGALQIVDRKKHLFKLAQGEYVAPEKVENVLAQCKVANAVFVDGDPLETYTVAIVAPNMDQVKLWTELPQNRAACLDADLYQLCATSLPLQSYVIEQLVKYGKQNGLNSMEIPKRILLIPDAFSVENGLLTPTMKLKRPDIRKKFKATLMALYGTKSEGAV